MTFALTAAGLSTETQSEIFDGLANQVQATFGTNTNVSISSLMGQWLNITAEISALNQAELLAVYRRFDPNSAAGVALNALAALTGSVRRGATQSVVEGFLTFSGAGTFANGGLVLNVGTQTTWQAIGGPYSDTGGPYPELVAATLQAVDTGPLQANSGTTWSIVTVTPNVTAYTNPSDDATLGQNEESDEDFRRRRQNELYSQNIGPLLAISGVVSKVDTENGQVTDVRTYHNPSVNPTDSDGIPFKAFNVVVETDPPLPVPQVAGPIEPLAQDIADAIFSATGAGGESYGTDYGVVSVISVTDVEGQAQGPILFDVVEQVDIFIDITLTLFTNNDDGPVVPEDPQQMADLIRTTTAESLTGSFVSLGRDARALDTSGVIQSLILDGEVSGVATAVVGVSLTQPAFPIASLTAPITIRQKPDYDTGNIRIEIDGVQY